MKIALVIGSYNATGGGAERWTDRYARWLIQRGCQVHLFARDFNGPPEEVCCHVVDVSPAAAFKRLRFAGRAEAMLRRERFDVVHDMGDGWRADVFMPHHGTRVAGFAQNSALLPAPMSWCRGVVYELFPRYREFQMLERRQYANTQTVFVALSRMVKAHMQTHYAVDESAVRIVYNGVDVESFRPASDKARRKDARRRLGFNDETVYLFIAHNFRLKGLDTLLAALATLSATERAGLIVAGAGQQRQYRRLARKVGVADRVRFVGDLPDPLAVYQAADVFIQPTFYDPCSLVTLEALACGLPVVTTRHNGVSELMTHGKEGFVLDDPLDVASLAERMAKLADPPTRALAAGHARALAERFSLEKNCERMMALYESLGRASKAA